MEEKNKRPILLKSFKANIPSVLSAIDFAFKHSELYSFNVYYQLTWNAKPKKQPREKYSIVRPFMLNLINASTIDVVYEEGDITIKMEPKEHICPICGKAYYGFGKKGEDNIVICPSCYEHKQLEKVYELEAN